MSELIPASPSTSLLYMDKCLVCGEPASKRCGGCNLAFYCSAEHQRTDWTRHKSDCKIYKIQVVEDLGECLVASKMLPPGTRILAEYPVALYEESPSDQLESSCKQSLQKLLLVADACPFKCPGCETGWTSGNSCHSCSKCGIPLCSKACEEPSSKHSLNECKALTDMEYFEKRSPKTEMTQIWRDLLIFRMIQREKNKGNKISQKNSRWEVLFKSNNSIEEEKLDFKERIEKLLPLSAKALEGDEGKSKTLYRLYHTLQECSLSLDSITKRKRALYEKFHLLCHSCAPNTEWWIDNDQFYYKLMARAIKPILPGERISINRCSHLDPSLLFNPTLQRRQKIQKLLSLDCRCERCTDMFEKGSCISGIRCNVCKDALSCNYLFPTNPLDKRTSWTCSGKNCKATKTFEQIFVVTVKAEKELEQISSSSTSVEVVITKLLDFIVKHQRKILHPSHYLIMIARSRINKAVGCFLGSGEKMFLCVINELPRSFDYCTYKTDYLHAYLAFLAKLYDTMPERIAGKIRYELGYAEAALLIQDFQMERMGATTFFRRLNSIMENLNKAKIILSYYSDCSGLVDDIRKFSKMLRELFGSGLSPARRLKNLDESDETLKIKVAEATESWKEACLAIDLKRMYLNPECSHLSMSSISRLINDLNNNEVKYVTKQDLQMILLDAHGVTN